MLNAVSISRFPRTCGKFRWIFRCKTDAERFLSESKWWRSRGGAPWKRTRFSRGIFWPKVLLCYVMFCFVLLLVKSDKEWYLLLPKVVMETNKLLGYRLFLLDPLRRLFPISLFLESSLNFSCCRCFGHFWSCDCNFQGGVVLLLWRINYPLPIKLYLAILWPCVVTLKNWGNPAPGKPLTGTKLTQELQLPSGQYKCPPDPQIWALFLNRKSQVAWQPIRLVKSL